ncbi:MULTISPECIES: hypothetical protein [Actinomycetes]|uniref:hypothetical protein n=1 Tax=Actinomycetes TaxID=1760 RepID=UPI00177CF6CF|nr:hypothetical protein GCM10020241_35170 [Streptoalloteichus tenebrarius]BFF03106.1 hypothetical protein GCM10020241_47810 [Streptoalloteichus tenebrarius]GHE84281.1 hypothetical protein GCM10018782_65470 [Streptomyces griseoaurantiacus]
MNRLVPSRAVEVRENGHRPPGQAGVAYVGLPTAWLHLDGYTVRWGRGDHVVTVHRGHHVASYFNKHLVDVFTVGKDWEDDSDILRVARAWLDRQRHQARGRST